ncbi:MAG TPA: O-antigen ligase family protein [Thermoanaerobaculia bacterium]|nr:O-antigen ligase family protein [Thermoanaerobaculia bacterium]
MTVPRPSAWPSERRESVGFGLYLGQLVAIFGIALSGALLTVGLLTAWWSTRGRLLERLARSRATPLLAPLLAYAALLVLSVAFSYDPLHSVEGLTELIALSPLPLALLYVRGEERCRLVVHAVIAIGALFALYGLVETAFAGGVGLASRPHGPFSHYQTFAGVLLLCDLVAVSTLVYRRGARRWWHWAAALLISLALLLSLTRGAWVALIAGVLVLLVVRAPKALLWLVPLLVVLVLWLAPGPVVERAASIADLGDESNYDRLCMVYSGLRMIEERPLLGIGPSMVEELYPIYRHPTAPFLERPHLHNAFLHLAAERGVPALLAFLALLGGAVTVALREFRREGGREGARADLWVATVIGVAAFAIAGLFEDNWSDSEVQRVVLFLLALPFCLRNRPGPENQPAEEPL